MKIERQFVKGSTAVFGGVNQKQFITIHETGNRKRGANAKAHANLQQNGHHTSWHWQVDDQLAIQSYPHTAQCWHAGDGRGPGNLTSIAIEICVHEDGDYLKALQHAIRLTKKIMKDEQISLSRVVQHHYWSGKDCPALLRRGSNGMNWSQFKAQLQPENQPSLYGQTVMRKGDVGEGIRTLQRRLRKLGYLIVKDGSYGPETRFAICFLQARHGLLVDGIAGPTTQALIGKVEKNSRSIPIRAVQYGQSNEAVKVVQQALNRLGEQLVIDGSFGPKTAQAVRTFQQKNRLVIDGSVGPLTWKALQHAVFT